MRRHFERLSAVDAAFLEIEDENSPMHVGAVAIFEASRAAASRSSPRRITA